MRVKRIMALLLASALVMGGMLTADASEIGQNAANESSTEENTDTAAEEPVDSAGEDDADTVTDAAESAADNKNDVTDTVIDNTADDSAAVEDESGLTEIDGVLYINGIPVDYDDPYCLKYIENYYSNGIATASVSTTDYYTNWNGKTYYHKESAAKGKDISVGMDVSK